MSATQPRAGIPTVYEGAGPFVYAPVEQAYTAGTAEGAEMNSLPRTTPSVLYRAARILSTATAIGFGVLLILSLATGGPIHWAVAVVGCLGAIGLAGAVWLSQHRFYV